MRRWITVVLLVLATIHCGRSIFYDNAGFVDLRKYALGQEDNPFQSRVTMMPLLRWAHTSRLAARLIGYDMDTHSQAHTVLEPHIPERAVTETVGILCLLVMVGVLIGWGWSRFGALWWAPAALLIAMMEVSYAARYMQSIWWPYDLPHYLFFGLAFYFLMQKRLALMLLCFACDVPTCEKAVYLIPCVLALLPYTTEKRKVIACLAAMAVYFAAVRGAIAHTFAHNHTAAGVYYQQNYHALIGPRYWAQLASAVGFLLLPLFLCRRYLQPEHRALLYSFVPGLLVTALFGIWFESRVWGEWCMPAAMLLMLEWQGRYGSDEAGLLPAGERLAAVPAAYSSAHD